MLLNVNWTGSAFQFFNRPITIDAYDESITKHGTLTEIIKVTENSRNATVSECSFALNH